MDKAIAIIHYNTPELTLALVNSINLHSPGCRIVVFDNSDERPFPYVAGVERIDNTKGQLIDFDDIIRNCPDKIPTASNWGSEKHILSVDYLFDVLTDGFLLLDSDVLIKKDISEFFNQDFAWQGQIEPPPFKSWMSRLFPFILWINVPMCRKYGVRFYHEKQLFKLSYDRIKTYDTGASFYNDCVSAGLPGKQVPIFEYIEHLGSGSWKGSRANAILWLHKHEHLYTKNENLHKDMEETKTKAKNTTSSSKEKILVVIPYCSEGAQGRELEYAVAGWRKHFKEDYLIVLAGEKHPICDTGDDITCIESERVPAKQGNYRQHLDYVSCLKKVRQAFPKSKGFVMVADDCYAVNDFDMADIMVLKQKADEMGGSHTSINGWQRDKARTRDILISGGYPTRNFTTHLPQYYEWDKLEQLWDRYDMGNTSYVMEDLYYNIYYPTRIPLQLHIDHDNFKCGIYRSNPRLDYIDRAFLKQIWITNSPEGWIPALETSLKHHYCID